MRPILLMCALGVALQLLCGTALADPGGGGWTWPIRGPVLTAYRNGADPYAGGQHRGIDIGAPVGSTVVAATSGTITFAGTVGVSGLTVSERTADGRFDLSYLHLSRVSVHRGDTVGSGAPIAAVGTTGRRSIAAPHLHFGVREAGSHTAYRDPLDFLAPPTPANPPRPAPVPVAHPAAGEPAPAAHAHHPAFAPHHVAIPHTGPAAHPVSAPHAHPVPGALTAPHGLAAPHASPSSPPFAGPRVFAPRASTSGGSHRTALPSAVATPAHPADTGPQTGSRPAGGPSPTPLRGQSSTAPLPATPHHSHAAPQHHGIDLGWLAACLGLVALATALGHPTGTTRLANRSRARITALLRLAPRRG